MENAKYEDLYTQKQIIMKILILFVLTAALLVSCKKCYFDSDNAVIKNESDKNIVILKLYYDYQKNPNDTIIYDDFSVYELSMRSIKPKETLSIIYWNKREKDVISAADTFSVHILDEEVVYEYSWKEVCNKYKVLCRYDLSGQDIINLNFTIPYPPSPEMKNMKMYPPYEEIINRY